MKLKNLINWFFTKCGAMVKCFFKKESKKENKSKIKNSDDIYPLW